MDKSSAVQLQLLFAVALSKLGPPPQLIQECATNSDATFGRIGCAQHYLTALEGENATLKKLMAEAMLDNTMLKGIAIQNV
jgi:hypothetical protein